jgi:hypothetical protein
MLSREVGRWRSVEVGDEVEGIADGVGAVVDGVGALSAGVNATSASDTAFKRLPVSAPSSGLEVADGAGDGFGDAHRKKLQSFPSSRLARQSTYCRPPFPLRLVRLIMIGSVRSHVAHVYVRGSCDIVGAAMLEGVRLETTKFPAMNLQCC